jgi:mono/diheme cytochrome c family protein
MTKRNSLALAALWTAVAVSMFAPPNDIVRARGYKTLSSASGSSGADGVALFDGKCALCHGKDGAGLPNWRSQGQPDFTKPEWQSSHTDEQIAAAIKNGKGKFMPAYKGKLSDEETGAVVQRIRAFGKKK